MEKPCVLRVDQVITLSELSRRQGKIFMAGHLMEYSPALRCLKDYLGTGKLGKLFYLSFVRTNLGLVRPDVNVLWDLAVHDLSMLRFLLEVEPEKVSAQGACYLQTGIQDVVFLSLRFPGNVLARYDFIPRFGDIYIPSVNTKEPLLNQCQHFLECIQE